MKIAQKFLWLTFIDGDVAVDAEKIEANDVEKKVAVNDRRLKIEKYQMVVARKIEQRVI